MLRRLLPSVALVAALTAFDLWLRWDVIAAWELRDQRVYAASVVASPLFWWAVLELQAIFAARGRGGEAGAWIVRGLAALLLWIPFVVFHRYGTFPTREGTLLVANELGFATEAAGGMLGLNEILGFGGAALFIGFFCIVRGRAEAHAKLPGAVTALVLFIAAAAGANLRPTYPVTAETNSIRFLSRLMAWAHNPPRFFNLAARHPAPIPAAPLAAERPVDVLLVIGETLGAQYLKPFGAPTDPAPALGTWMAREDVVPLQRLHSNASCTDLSLPSILTGMAPTVPLGKLLASRTLFDAFKARGYKTFFHSAHNLRWANLATFLRNENIDDFFAAETVDQNASHNIGIPDGDVLRRSLAQIAVHQERGERFFGVAQLNTSHPPYQTKAGLEPFDTATAAPFHTPIFARYLNSVRFFDETFGGFLADLAARPGFRDLVVVMTADHGEAFGQHGIDSHCGKFHVEEAHVPGFVRLPEGLGPFAAPLRKRGTDFAMNVDLYPTIVGLAELRVDLGEQLDGESLLAPATPSHPYVFSNCAEFRNCSLPHFGVYKGGIKYLYDGVLRRWSAYDVAADPTDARDVMKRHEEELAALMPWVRANNVLSGIIDGRD